MKTIHIELQQQIRKKYLEAECPKDTPPLLYAMVGIPASGKSTFLKIQHERGNLPTGHYYHDPDCIMELIPDYHTDLQNHGSKSAKQKWELPSRTFADTELFPRAVDMGLNIVMDMGLCRHEILNMVNKCQKAGYHVHMQLIYCELKIAIERSADREKYVAEQIIRDRAEFLSKHIATILSLSDRANAYDNSDLNRPYQPLNLKKARTRVKNYGLCSTG